MQVLHKLGSVSDKTWTVLAAALFAVTLLVVVASVYRTHLSPTKAGFPVPEPEGRHLSEHQGMVILSQGITGNPSAGESGAVSMSGNGEFVVFESNAADLVKDDSNSVFDIFLLDVGQSSLTKIGIDSGLSDGNSRGPAISDNGEVVVFESSTTNLVKTDANSASDIFAFDRNTGNFERVSIRSDGVEADGGSFGASISADGRYVAFGSNATNLVADDINAAPDVFLHDRQTGKTTRISVDSDGKAPLDRSNPSSEPALSANGEVVAFSSYSSVLVDVDTKGRANIFTRDLTTNTTTLVSVGLAGLPANGESSQPSISADGRYVSFTSRASNLVDGDNNDMSDIFLYDRKLGQTRILSNGAGSTPSDGFSAESHISADGSVVVFRSQATNLTTAGNANNLDEIFIHEIDSGITRRAGDVEGNGRSLNPVIDANATHLAFTSHASNLAKKDENDLPDVFLVELK